jgi:diguanylate cyclase (GGDEF)-like protein/PAS domain S-box-containing protein
MRTAAAQDALLDQISDAFYALDREWRFTYVNRQCEVWLRRTRAELLGRVVWEAFPEAVGAIFETEYRRAITDGVTVTFETYFPPLESWFEVRAYPADDGLAVIFRDVTQQRLTNERLHFQASLLDIVEQAVIAVDLDGLVAYWNRGAEQLFGWSAEEVMGQPVLATIESQLSPDDAAALLQRWRNGQHDGGDFLAHRKDGSTFWARATDSPMRDNSGTIAGTLGMVSDVTDRLAAEASLRASEELFRSAFDDAPIGVAIIGMDGQILRANPALSHMTGYSSAELEGQPASGTLHPDDVSLSAAQLQRLQSGHVTSYQDERRLVHRDGSVLWCLTNVALVREPDGAPRFFLAQVQDITARKTLEEQLSHQALHDSLTGLPNRSLLLDRLEQVVVHSRHANTWMAVIFVDIDDFKIVNDSLGHTAGDQLLVTVGHRLQSCVAETDTVARFGGDEFVVVLAETSGMSETVDVAERILAAVSTPFRVQGRELTVSVSLGIALSSAGEVDRNELLLRADTAMYRAKDAGKSSYHLFTPAMQGEALLRLDMEADLRRAVERGEFMLHYQPKVSLSTGEIVGVEALIRWHHPVHGTVSPAQFIPVAEHSGLILPIGRWVLHQACAQAARWLALYTGHEPFTMNVNLSSRQFAQADLVADVAATLNASGLPAEHLTIEITESDVMRDATSAILRLHDLKALGVRIAVDDFGTGYSSLAYLKLFPVDVLKIDQAFVRGLGIESADTAIVEATIGLAHALGMRVVAEGVETAEQAELLRARGCERAQGYFFHRPLPAEDITTLLRDPNGRL